MFKLLKELKWVVMMEALIVYRQGWRATLAWNHKVAKLELPRAWEPLDRPKRSHDCEGASSHGLFSYGDKTTMSWPKS